MAFDNLISQFARNLARQVADQFEAAIGQELGARAGSTLGKVRGKPGPKPGAAKAKRGSTKGRKMNMDCRVCGMRSKGPNTRFMCEEHMKLPKKEQDAAIERWKEAHKA